MAGLTDAEWRGARVLAVLLLLGTAHDLWEARHPRTSASLDPGPAVSAPPAEGGAAPGAADTTRTRVPVLTDLNQADERALDALPGIGPVLARRIVEHRRRQGPFRRIDELLAVPGIGPRLLERLRPHLREPAVAR